MLNSDLWYVVAPSCITKWRRLDIVMLRNCRSLFAMQKGDAKRRPSAFKISRSKDLGGCCCAGRGASICSCRSSTTVRGCACCCRRGAFWGCGSAGRRCLTVSSRGRCRSAFAAGTATSGKRRCQCKASRGKSNRLEFHHKPHSSPS